MFRQSEMPYAIPAAPKTPNLMASLNFSTLSELKVPQRRLHKNLISCRFNWFDSSLCVKGTIGSESVSECADGKVFFLEIVCSVLFCRNECGAFKRTLITVDQRLERRP